MHVRRIISGDCYAANDVDHFHLLLYNRLDEVLGLCEPQKSVVFALDGPAPLAKLITQRCGWVHAPRPFSEGMHACRSRAGQELLTSCLTQSYTEHACMV